MEYPFFCKLIRWELTSLNILFLLLKHGKYLHSLIIFFWKVLYLAAYKLIFPLTTGCIFLLLCISGNFLTLDNVNFVFWGSGLFISVNSCEHCSGMQFSVEILESFSHGIGFLCVFASSWSSAHLPLSIAIHFFVDARYVTLSGSFHFHDMLLNRVWWQFVSVLFLLLGIICLCASLSL